jgi:hypothetical protein
MTASAPWEVEYDWFDVCRMILLAGILVVLAVPFAGIVLFVGGGFVLADSCRFVSFFHVAEILELSSHMAVCVMLMMLATYLLAPPVLYAWLVKKCKAALKAEEEKKVA